MKRVLKRNSSCVDVGAHEGAILRSMVRIAPRGKHFAFEPLPHLAERLRKAYPGVRVVEAAVSDSSGEMEFLHVENDPAYSGLRQRVYDRDDPVIKPLTVRVVRMDEVIPDDLPVAFIKIDIEGGEFHAMCGAARIVERCRPVIVFEAGEKSTGQYGVTPEELFRLVTEKFGYRLSTMRRWLVMEPDYTLEEFCWNWQNGPDFYFIAAPTPSRHG
jgi:FkbM family methyltransferase